MLDLGDTLTGGLPYFGGPGNSYSLHGIAETVAAMRDKLHFQDLVNGRMSGNGIIGEAACRIIKRLGLGNHLSSVVKISRFIDNMH